MRMVKISKNRECTYKHKRHCCYAHEDDPRPSHQYNTHKTLPMPEEELWLNVYGK